MKKTLLLTSVWMVGSLVAVAADAPAPSIWQTRMRAVQQVVRQVFPKVAANSFYPITVVETADLSGLGTSDALISLGSGGYTDEVTVMQLHQDAPIAAKFHRGGTVGPMVFTSGNADDRGGEVKLLATDHAIFAGYWEMKGAKLKECRGEVYQWDEKEKNFGYSKKLSKERGKSYCDNVIAKLKK